MRLNPFFMPALSITLLFGTAFGAQAVGVWSTSGRDTSALESLTPADVKGWMTLQQISDGVPIPLDELYELVEIPSDVPADTALKDLEGVVPDFEVTVLRDRLTTWQIGGDATPEPTVAPTSAPAATPLPSPTPTARPTDSSDQQPATPEAGATACDIRGKMTLQEVSASCGVTLERLIGASGLPADTAAEAVLKDLISQGVLPDIETIRTAVATLQSDSTP